MKFYQATWGYSAMTNNTYYDDEHRTVYKVNTPFKITNRTSTIIKMLDPQPEVAPPNSGQENVNLVDLGSGEEGQSSGLRRRRSSAKSATSNIDPDQRNGDWEEDSSMPEMPAGGEPSFGGPRYGQTFEYLAQIDWRFFTSSKFRFGDGMEVMSKDFFRKEGWGPYGRHRVFTAKDGKEYKWLLGWWESELILNDGSKTQVAKFNRKSFGVIGKASPAYLEIFPPGEHMVDEIFVTFVYIEKLRKEKERAAKHNGGAFPSIIILTSFAGPDPTLQMSIHNSQFSVRGKPTFNNVHGDQVNNHTTITAAVVHMRGDDTTVAKYTVSDEFEYVKRGHVIGMKELGSIDLSECDWHQKNGKCVGKLRKSARKTISTVEIHPDRQSKFTAITYEGKDAQEAWEKDFKQFLHARLVAVSLETKLLLISGQSDGLIPTLWYQSIGDPNADLSSCEGALWMDARKGIFCSGPAGPPVMFPEFLTHAPVIQALPSTLDMLEEGSSIAFFSKFGSSMDSGILNHAATFYANNYFDDFLKATEDHQHEDSNHPQWTTDHSYLERLWRNPPRHPPIDIIGGLRFDTVYLPSLEPIARWPPESPGLWKWTDVIGLMEETRVDGGLTRFKLIDQGGEVGLRVAFNWEMLWQGWLSQSSRMFDLLKMTGHQESFFVVDPPWKLELRPTQCEHTIHDTLPAPFDLRDAVEETRPIYLFLYPPPMTVLELMPWTDGHTHFWSFDEDGQSRIPEAEWRQWGIPILTLSICGSSDGLLSWPTYVYTALRNWQIARGFDPSTADWARECGYLELEIVRRKEGDQLEQMPEQPGVFLSIIATQDEH
ncbi:hypothetical protein Moror_10690 [Moniliophthora roreri MCA 2997]|uniref:DUF6593 domain-containing protein n=1 Tax=Moniliophthora roreri (strain MCA 2997) TaxID=1381753 RepID=V2YIZ0_MONRO|nr:hypothetical protein Moror_10690 [Moniliophthora roreri MCA 2997]